MIELVIGNNLNRVFENVVSKIENSRSLELENFIIVPDRFSLLAEKHIFSILNLTSSFSIKVLGISKLQKFFAKEIEILSADESRLLIYSILEKNDFELIKPSFEIATEIFNIISQLKSSNVSYSQFLEKASNEKLIEIARIFEIYETTKTKADQGDILNNISNNLNLEKISKCNFYICGFDNLTSQAFRVVEKILLNAKKVVIGATFPENQKNFNIYENDVYNKLIRFSKENKIQIRKSYVNSNEDSISNHILKNLFSYTPKQIETNKVHLLEFETPEKEITEIAKTIKFYVKYKNYKYSDFNVLSGDLEQFSGEISRVFEQYDIPYYSDNNQKIIDLPIYSFFKALFNFIQTNNETAFYELLLNPYCDINKDEFSKVIIRTDYNGFFSLDLLENFENIKLFIEKINYFKEKLIKINNLFDFSKIILEIIEKFSLKEKNENILNNLNNDLKTQKIYSQIFRNIDSLLSVFSTKETSLFDSAAELFLNLLGEKEISSVPLSVDCVFIGGENSFFGNRKVMFVSNALYGTLPKISKDLGLFSDEDINSVDLDIQPTIKLINKRNRQKLLFTLSQSEEFFISVCGSEVGEKVEKSVLFYELQKLFLFKEKPIQIFNDFYSVLFEEKNYSQFIVQTLSDYEKQVIKLKNNNKISIEDFERLIGKQFVQEEKINCSKDLFRHFSPTEIEKFFQCPFKHFFNYGIRIKENPLNKFDGRDFGNYFHILAENFVKRNVGKVGGMTDKEIKQELSKIEELIKNEPRFEQLSKNINNSNVFLQLKREGEMMLKNINHEQHYSNFIAKFFEQSFQLKTRFSKIIGIIDRIDLCDDMFRVVDYKTGEVKKSLRAVFEGIELQLFIYILATIDKFGYQPAGGFYFSVAGDFNKDKNSKNKLDGFVVNDQAVLKNLDRRFGSITESDFICLKLSSKSTFDNLITSTRKNVFSKEGFEAVLQYVNLLIQKAEEEILSGEIPAKPLGEEACLNCSLFSVCSFKQNSFEQPKKIEGELQENDFIRIVKNEKN